MVKIFLLYLFINNCFNVAQAQRKEFDYSKIIEVPDLSFFNHVYTGLDILEQMDYKHIKNKSIGIFCNQTAVTL